MQPSAEGTQKTATVQVPVAGVAIAAASAHAWSRGPRAEAQKVPAVPAPVADVANAAASPQARPHSRDPPAQAPKGAPGYACGGRAVRVGAEPVGVEDVSGHDSHRLSTDPGTIGSHMRALQNEDPRRLLVARRCNTLGFDSAEMLTAHFSQFGEVSRVLVAHSRVKRGFGQGAAAPKRTRPGNIAFVIMADTASIPRIWQEGGEQMVAGRWISIEPFGSAAAQSRPSEPPSPSSARTRDPSRSASSSGSHRSAGSTSCATDPVAH